jgi:hypothetical protein
VESVGDNFKSMFETGVCPLPVTIDCNATGALAKEIRILHDDKTFALYTHFILNGALKSVGESVANKVLIGRSGNTGYSSGAHLHVETRKPLSFFDTRSTVNEFTFETLPVTYITASGQRLVPQEGRTYQSIDIYAVPTGNSPTSLSTTGNSPSSLQNPTSLSTNGFSPAPKSTPTSETTDSIMASPFIAMMSTSLCYCVFKN